MDTGIAIIGAGFSGLAAAIRLRQEGRDDFVVLERHEDVGGTWWANTYPGCACDVPSHLYSLSFAPNPDWTRDLLLAARDPRLPPAARPRARPRRARSASPRRSRRRPGTRTTRRWVLADVRRHRPRPLPDRRAGPARRAAAARHPGPGALRRHRVPLGASGTTGTTCAARRVAVIGTGASAIQFVPAIQPEVGHAPRLPAHRAVGDAAREPHDLRARARALPALPRGAEARPRGHLRRARGARGRARQAPGAAGRRRARGARATGARRSPTPSCGARSHRTSASAASGSCRRTTGIRRSQQPNVELVTDRIAEIREHAIVDRRRHGARGRHDHLRHRLPRRRHAGRRVGRGARRDDARRRLGGQPEGLPRHGHARLPEPVPPARAEHRARALARSST